jgi:hypothetical protein
MYSPNAKKEKKAESRSERFTQTQNAGGIKFKTKQVPHRFKKVWGVHFQSSTIFLAPFVSMCPFRFDSVHRRVNHEA